MSYHPFHELGDVSDQIDHPPRTDHVREFSEEWRRDDALAVVLALEVRVGKAEEELRKLPFLEEVWQETHRVVVYSPHVVVSRTVVCRMVDESMCFELCVAEVWRQRL